MAGGQACSLPRPAVPGRWRRDVRQEARGEMRRMKHARARAAVEIWLTYKRPGLLVGQGEAPQVQFLEELLGGGQVRGVEFVELEQLA